eukprot:s602_g16.t2
MAADGYAQLVETPQDVDRVTWILALVPEKNPGLWVTINIVMLIWSSFMLVTIFLDAKRDEFREQLYLSWSFATTAVWVAEVMLEATARVQRANRGRFRMGDDKFDRIISTAAYVYASEETLRLLCLTRNVVTETPLEEGMDSNVQEAVSQYSGAYKKTPRCVWTQSETDLFYEALSLYGSDLFLVQTFFRNKSAGQIKTKYNKDQTLQDAPETFEKLHGKIDTSRHYKPPPEPQPGDEPEPEVPLPEEDDDLGDLGGMPPPEPEYCAEDESLTTNRLMALFD